MIETNLDSIQFSDCFRTINLLSQNPFLLINRLGIRNDVKLHGFKLCERHFMKTVVVRTELDGLLTGCFQSNDQAGYDPH